MDTGLFRIRRAVDTKEDIDAIITLVKELAIYEKTEESAKATPELIKQNLFTKPFAHALLAMSPEGQAVGLALYFFNFSTWTGRPGLYLEDLFVEPEFRSKGLGKAFFAELAKVAQENNCARMDWSVLKWNTPSIDFYEKCLGAFPMSEWMGMRLEEEGIENLKKFSLPR
ncbi:acyl-CoA N-acyltransferase [Fomitiporia mediterranea MF3/22]|uniref:acyl-CoA N-acyltransferase n=1 Tax=Fomitiporia mediterranea (strain MF3/22) TaxID=694068 RepID=UPI0004408F02|nr:acyl-CoA N-acyltransferase [Fomitiporia mediterranea MF3/22]EJC99231.1 acyl-CoA N-acyltransferase [Fomitiporia mediterranea MF3/22]